MQILINIPDYAYNNIMGKCGGYTLYEQAIHDGIVLPKKYGRLIDADSACEGNCAECPVNDICIVNKAPTVIEAYEGAE